MHLAKIPDFSRIAQDLQIRKVQVESVVQLLDEDNTVPFITRYRKERTGGLDEEVIRQIQARVAQLRHLAERKTTILKSIENQGKLTDELRDAVVAAETPKRLEDLYLPYKPKKRTLATAARERGLEPLALAVWGRDPAVTNLDEIWPTMVNPEKELPTIEEVRQGVGHILAELIAETADVRHAVRLVLWDTGKLTSAKAENLQENQGEDYKVYFQFTEPARHIPPHRILAINRGEKEKVLKVKLEADTEAARKAIQDKLPLADHPHAEFLKTVADDALSRLLLPSLEREIRRELTEEAEVHAVKVFARNLHSLLLQPPLHGRRVLAIDPGFRTGCKVAALDETGNLLDHAVVFPHAPQNKKPDARVKLEELIRRHQLNVIAIGNGTACRETEELVAELIGALEKRRQGIDAGADSATAPAPAPAVSAPVPSEPAPAPPVGAEAAAPLPPSAGESSNPSQLEASSPAPVDPSRETTTPVAAPAPPSVPADLPAAPAELAYVIVNEAGASVYSASAVGREEFPDYDATLRGTISIGRRLQDPLSELVKIDPQNIGVGLYQHDIHPRVLKESLDAVIESSVNHVGVDLNTASVPLLRHVAGFNQLVARDVVEFRKQNGPFKNREQLMQVPNIGPARYVQAAGFLKVFGENPLDRTWIHPESYPVAQQLLTDLGFGPDALIEKEKNSALRDQFNMLSPPEVSARLQVSEPTLFDLLDALARPGRDPREDLPPPIFKKGILKLEDLQSGMELKGTVLNVVDFGAFVDIGLKDSGLVHISQMANRYIKNPYDVVAVGDVATVWVLKVEQDRRRVSLTMIRPGSEHKPPERKQQDQRPPRAQRPAPPRRPPARRQMAAAATSGATTAEAGSAAAAPSRQLAPSARPAPPARKPKRQLPKPKLSQDALERKVPLRSFRELEAFFETTAQEPPPAPATEATQAREGSETSGS